MFNQMKVPVIVALDASIRVAGEEDGVLAAARDAAVVLLELCPEHGELVYGMQFVHLLHSLVLVVHKHRHAHWCSLVLVRKTYANLGSV